MSALVGYGSSDDEDSPLRSDNMLEAIDASNTIASSSPKRSENHTNGASDTSKPYNSDPASETPLNSSLLGPSLASDVSHPDSRSSTSFHSALSGSPYTRSRLALRALTLPQLPQLDIPPSPPGSPPPNLETKLGQFESLRQQGVHFNSKLAASSALKNPSLLPKLLAAAGLVEELQYANTLGNEALVPTEYLSCAYMESLDVSQEELIRAAAKEKEGRARNFVPAAQPIVPVAQVSDVEPSTVQHVRVRPHPDHEYSAGEYPGARKHDTDRGGSKRS